MATTPQDETTGSSNTFEGSSGSVTAMHVWNLGPAGAVTTGSESFNYVLSGATWIGETEFRDVILSGTSPVVGSVAITNNPNVLLKLNHTVRFVNLLRGVMLRVRQINIKVH